MLLFSLLSNFSSSVLDGGSRRDPLLRTEGRALGHRYNRLPGVKQVTVLPAGAAPLTGKPRVSSWTKTKLFPPPGGGFCLLPKSLSVLCHITKWGPRCISVTLTHRQGRRKLAAGAASGPCGRRRSGGVRRMRSRASAGSWRLP